MAQKLKKNHPLVGMKVSFPFEVAAICWTDLLGYGSHIAAANFNPLDPSAADAVKRLRTFHEVVARHSLRYFRTLTINDGAVAYRDLSLRNRSVAHDFFMRSWRMFNDLNAEEKRNNHPGARMVLATGFRIKGRKAGFVGTSKLFQSIMARYQQKAITAEQAIQEAAAIRQYSDVIPQLQANFAFTKAYLAESGGSKAGLPGNNFFVESAFFRSGSPPWVLAEPLISWSNAKPPMKADFYQIRDVLPWKHAEGGPVEMRSGLEVAKYLSNDENVLTALRKAKK